MSMDELIAKLEQASEGSRELDGLIAVAAFERVCTDDDLIYAVAIRPYDECARGTFWRVSRSGRSLHTAPFYTTSLDAALTLVPEGWGVSIHSSPAAHNCAQSATLNRGQPPFFDDEEIDADADTAILALCIAALKASATTGGKE